MCSLGTHTQCNTLLSSLKGILIYIQIGQHTRNCCCLLVFSFLLLGAGKCPRLTNITKADGGLTSQLFVVDRNCEAFSESRHWDFWILKKGINMIEEEFNRRERKTVKSPMWVSKSPMWLVEACRQPIQFKADINVHQAIMVIRCGHLPSARN